MKFRPKDWNNPHGGYAEGKLNPVFEAGADAILEELIKNNQLDHIEVRGRKCKVVFIPEGE